MPKLHKRFWWKELIPNLGQALSSQTKWHEALNNMRELVKNGPPKADTNMIFSDEDMWAREAVFMANYERARAGQDTARIISQLPEFPSCKKMVDLGGRPGLIGIYIVSEHPDMKGVIFDQPAVGTVAKSFIKEYGLEQRMEFMGGDYMKDSIR